MYMKTYMYYVIYEPEEKYTYDAIDIHENLNVFCDICKWRYMLLCDIFIWDVHVSCSIFTWTHKCIMVYIYTKIYMKLYMYYVIYLHEDIHVWCNILTWRYTICMKLYMCHVI